MAHAAPRGLIPQPLDTPPVKFPYGRDEYSKMRLLMNSCYNRGMINTALIGLGRIGRLHADNLMAHPRFRLCCVYDTDEQLARTVARQYELTVASDAAAIFADAAINAVVIASPTATHCDLIEQAAQAGQAILCEKPVDLDSRRARQCAAVLADLTAPVVQIGFNRRFDPGHAALIKRVKDGDIGALEKVIITSRDPDLPSADYLAASGGLFHDMMIHDFDMARALLPQEPARVFTAAAALAAPAVCEQVGDVDTAMAILQTDSGILCHINCSRRAVYGYDQRLEAFGSAGMLLSNNRTQTPLEWSHRAATACREPLLNFFMQRYADSYALQLDAFAAAAGGEAAPSPDFTDGLRALQLADAAREAMQSGQWAAAGKD